VKGAIFTVDTSCVVAAVCAWHEHHAAAADEIEERLDRGERLVVAAHVLVEAYAVLTRLTPPHRLAPADAWTLIRANFVEQAGIAALTGPQHVSLIGKLAAANIRGGRTYDAVIGAAAEKAGAAILLTFNPRHFEPAPEGILVVVPQGS
jgi:predicted nucleic acid-binding protein